MHNCIVCSCVASLYCGWVHVTFQVSSSTKQTSIFCTFVYFLPSLGDHVHPQRACFTKCLHTFWASVSFHSTVGEQWACAFSDVQLDQMTCCIGHKRMVFLCCGLACASPDVLLDQMSYCKLNKCVSFFSVGEHVRFHMLSFTKWLIALDTSMSSFFAVGYHVIFQSSCMTE